MNRYVPIAIAFLISIPFLIKGIPWRLLYPNSTLMLLFNHEVHYVVTTQSLVFFNAGAIHSFFPLSYVFARILFLFVPSPVLVEFVSPAVITFILLVALSVSWLRNLPSAEWYLTWFALGGLVLLFVSGSITVFWLWFSSVGLWGFLVFLCFLRSARGSSMGSHSFSLVALVLLVSMLLGDDGIAFLAAVIALVIHAGLLRRDRLPYLRWVLLSAIMFLSYDAVIGFVGESYYGSYLPVLRQQLSDLLSFNLQLSAHLGQLSLPLFQTVASGIAFLTMFGIIPILLLRNSLRQGWSPMSLVLPAVILVIGVALRLSNTITSQPAFVGALYEYVLYLVLPVAVLMTLHTRLETNRTFGRSQIYRHSYLFFLAVSLCVLIIATFQINPLIPTGKINSVTDPRVEPTFVQAAGVYTSRFALGPLTITQISDTSVLFVNPSNPSSRYLLTSLLPTPYGQRFGLTSKTGLYYTNGPIIIVGK